MMSERMYQRVVDSLGGDSDEAAMITQLKATIARLEDDIQIARATIDVQRSLLASRGETIRQLADIAASLQQLGNVQFPALADALARLTSEALNYGTRGSL